MPSPATAEPNLNVAPDTRTAATQKLAESWVADLPPLGQELVDAAKSGKSVTEAALKSNANETQTVETTTVGESTGSGNQTVQSDPQRKLDKPDSQNPLAITTEDEPKWPRNAKDWDTFKSGQAEKLKAKDAELSQLKARVQEFEKVKPNAPDPKLKELETERDQLSEQLRLVSIEKHPKFEKYYTGKVNAQIEMAKRIVGKEQGDKIASLLNMPESPWRDEQLNALVNELPMIQQSRLGSVLNSLEEIKAERSSEIDRAKTDYEKLAAAEKEGQTKAQQELRSKAEQAFKENVAMAQDPAKGLFTYQLKEGDDEWNKGVNERIESAKTLLSGGADIPTAIRAALYAVSLPAILQSHKAVLAENEGLKAQVKALTSATPKVRSGPAAEAKPEPVQIGGTRPGISPTRKMGYDWGQELIEARNKAMQGDE